MMQKIANDAISRNGYSKSITVNDFMYFPTKTNDGMVIDVRENNKGSKTASLVGQYVIKGATLYYRQLSTGNLIKVN